MPNPDEWEYEELDPPVDLDIGCITQLVEYARPRRMKKPKGPRVRMGFQPPERAYEGDDNE